MSVELGAAAYILACVKKSINRCKPLLSYDDSTSHVSIRVGGLTQERHLQTLCARQQLYLGGFVLLRHLLSAVVADTVYVHLCFNKSASFIPYSYTPPHTQPIIYILFTHRFNFSFYIYSFFQVCYIINVVQSIKRKIIKSY